MNETKVGMMSIFGSRMTIDFGQLRKITTKRCLAVLKQVLTNNSPNAEV